MYSATRACPALRAAVLFLLIPAAALGQQGQTLWQFSADGARLIGSADHLEDGRPRLAFRCIAPGQPEARRASAASLVASAVAPGETALLLAPDLPMLSGGLPPSLRISVDGAALVEAPLALGAPENVPFLRIPRESPLLDAMAKGRSLTLAAASGGSAAFALEGAGEALARLKAHCAPTGSAASPVAPEPAASAPAPVPAPAPEPVRTATVAPDAAQSWARYGATLVSDRVLIRPDHPAKEPHPLEPLLALVGLSLLEEVTDPETVFAFGRFLQPADFARLARTNDVSDYKYKSLLRNDPFLRRDIMTEFEKLYRPSLVALAPKLPVRAAILLPASLGAYDFETGSFPLLTNLYGGSRQGMPVQIPGTNATITLDVVQIQSEIPVEPELARRITQSRVGNDFGGGQLSGFGLLLDLELLADGTAREKHDGTVELSLPAHVVSATLHYDEAATQRMTALKLSPVAAEVPDLPKPKPGSATAEGTSLTLEDIVSLALAKGVTVPQLERIASQAAAVRQVNEFDRPDAVRDLMARLTSSTPDAGRPMFLSGTIALGTYDNDAFPIESWRLGYLRSASSGKASLDGDDVQVDLHNPEGITRFPMDREAARRLIEDGRQFNVLFEVAPVRASVGEGRRGEPSVLVDFQALAVHLLSPREEGRTLAVLRVPEVKAPATGSAEAAEAQRPEGRPALTGELVRWLQIRHGQVTLDDGLLRSLLDERWTVESTLASGQGNASLPEPDSPCGAFFPPGGRQPTEADRTAMLPVFRAWLGRCLDLLPSGFRFEAQNGSYTGLRDRTVIAVRPEDPLFASGRDADLFRDGAAMTEAGLVSLTAAGFGMDDLVFALPPMPRPPNGARIDAVSVAFDVAQVTAVPRPAPQLPRLVMEVRPVEVQWWGRTGPGQRQLLLSQPVAAAPAPAPATPEPPPPAVSYDVVGVKLGMTPDEARAAIDAHMKVGRVLEMSTTGRPPLVPDQRTLLLIDEGASDFVTLMLGPKEWEPRVFGVGRTWFAPAGQIPEARLAEALQAKYGPPLPGQAGRWAAPGSGEDCFDFGAQWTVNWLRAAAVEGEAPPPLHGGEPVPDDPAARAAMTLALRLANLPFGIGLSRDEQPASCGETLRVDREANQMMGLRGIQIPESVSDRVTVTLFDPARYRAEADRIMEDRLSRMPKVDLKL
ncbi:hypothetical protein [Rhodobacter sp. NSM]|uniref:hypothetical protein n=1 Tax=Rhodobacter sp. NSM TaxID=3457501 RepID=UPI003FD6292D